MDKTYTFDELAPHAPRKKRATFEYDGMTWRVTEAWPVKSNTGKKIKGWDVTYTSEQGHVVKSEPIGQSRLNDPDRNWGMRRGEK